MKKSLTFILLLISVLAFSQNTGINFQGVGRNSAGAVLASTKISLRFSVIQSSETGTVEYIESKEVTTNAQGIFSVVIGDGIQISKTGNFTDINWKVNPKFLKVEMDAAGGSNFVAMGTTKLQAVPFAYYANGVNADNVDGVLSASKGGTGVASISELKTALSIDQINNTSDLAKPISTATQAALDTKISASNLSSTLSNKENSDNKSYATDLGGITASDTFFPSQKAVKTYVDAQINSGGVQDGGILTRHLADRAVSGIKLASEISGYKKFVDGAGSVTLSSSITTDIDVNTGNVAVGGTSNWQSFTAGSSGRLSAIEFQTVNPSSNGPAPVAYVEIYNGQGLTGALLGTSTNFSISGMGRNWYSFDLSSTNISLVSGSNYTARLVVNTSNQNYLYGDNALYNGGISNISSTWDFNIKTKIRQFSNDTFLTTSAANTLYGGLVTNATHTGEVTGATSLTITDGVISTAKMADGAITTAKMADATVSTAKITDAGVTTVKIADAGVTTAKLNDGSVTGAKLANSAVDLTTKVTGVLPTANIADGAVTTAKIANSAVDLTTKVTGVLPTANVADGAITTAKIANSAVDLTTKVTGVLPTANIADGAVTTAKIANSAVDLTTKVTGVLPTANVADGAITTAKIANSAVDLTTKVTGVLPTANGGTGTLTATANTIFAAPNGANGVPLFRNLVASDLPTLTSSYIANNGSTQQSANINIDGYAIIGGTISATSGIFSNTTTGSSIVGTLSSTQDINVNGIKIGIGAGNFTSNTAIGFESLKSNTNGERNVAIGYQSLASNTSGTNNIALSPQSLYSNTIGIGNIALGSAALRSNNDGYGNIGMGSSALYLNSNGNFNIALGETSLYKNSIGNNNIGLGSASLFENRDGSSNIAIGFASLASNRNGNRNIVIGESGLLSNQSGNNNIAIGFESLNTNTSGNYNTAIGYQANVSSGSLTNSTAIGNGAIVSASNQITLGNGSVTSLRAQVTSITALSDRRDKTDIKSITEGINFIKQLKPVTYTWNTRDKSKVGIKAAGFIAQDLLTLQKTSSIGDNLDLVSEDNPEKLEARYNNLLPVMVKAIQDQQAIIDELKKELEAVKKLIQKP